MAVPTQMFRGKPRFDSLNVGSTAILYKLLNLNDEQLGDAARALLGKSGNQVFMQQLPVAQSPTAPTVFEAPVLRTPELTRGSRQRVLILDDDAAFKDVVADVLSEAGYSVVAVQSGVDGIQDALTNDFDVILCDMMMPMLPGNLFYRTMDRMRPQLCNRFVFMTGHRENPKIREFIQNVGRPLLAKPFHCDDLLDTIAFVQISTGVGAPA